MAVLEVKNIHKSFDGATEVLQGIDFSLEQGEASCLGRARHLNILVQLYRSVLRIFAPLM